MIPKEYSFSVAFVYRLKYYLWLFIINPFHDPVRDLLLALRIIHHEGRQNYLLGYLPKEKDHEELRSYLVGLGFETKFPAWVDDDEVLGLRFRESFVRQYHLRIYKDGEVRGHYEYTPEAHPFAHIKELHMEPRKDKFLEVLRGWLVEENLELQNNFQQTEERELVEVSS